MAAPASQGSTNETERRFLVLPEFAPDLLDNLEGRTLINAYLTDDKACAVRVRVDGASNFLTVKGPKKAGSGVEVEVEVSDAQAAALLSLARAKVEKKRYQLDAGKGLTWEIDVFQGPCAGLVIAEIELPDMSVKFKMPDWLGPEVTDVGELANQALAFNGLPLAFIGMAQAADTE